MRHLSLLQVSVSICVKGTLLVRWPRSLKKGPGSCCVASPAVISPGPFSYFSGPGLLLLRTIPPVPSALLLVWV